MTLESLEGKRSFRNRHLMRAQLLPVSLTDRQTASLAGQSSRAFSSSSAFKKARSGVFPLKIHCHKPYRNCAHSVLITVKKKLGCTHTPQFLIPGTKCSTIMLMPGLPLKKNLSENWDSVKHNFIFRQFIQFCILQNSLHMQQAYANPMDPSIFPCKANPSSGWCLVGWRWGVYMNIWGQNSDAHDW